MGVVTGELPATGAPPWEAQSMARRNSRPVEGQSKKP